MKILEIINLIRMNEHPGNARPIDSKQNVERQTVQLTD